MSTVKSILTNEKYKGDALLQKTYTSDFLTKKKKINRGEVPQYYVKNNHEAIIEPAVFDMVQKLIKSNEQGKGRYSCVSIFSGKIKCGECGGWYGSKVWHSNDKYRRVIWQCSRKYNNKKKCRTPHVDEKTIRKAFISAVNKLVTSKEEIIEDLEQIKEEIFDSNEQAADKNIRKEAFEFFIQNFKKQRGIITEFDECLWLGTVDFVTVNEDIEITFRNGTKVKV